MAARRDDPSSTTSQVVDPRAEQTPAEQSAAASGDEPTVQLVAPHWMDAFDPSIDGVEPITHAPAVVEKGQIDAIKEAVKRHNEAVPGDDVRISVKGA